MDLSNSAHGYNILSIVFGEVVMQLVGFWVGQARKNAKVKYPAVYVNKAEKNSAEFVFNCAQRAHQNPLEHRAGFLVCQCITALVSPEAAAIIGFAWGIGVYGYASGYIKNGPDGRYKTTGILMRLASLGALIGAGYAGLKYGKVIG